MKTRIALGTGLLLTLSTAVAGTLMYGQERPATTDVYAQAPAAAQVEPTPAMIAMWKARAVTTDYIAPKVPI